MSLFHEKPCASCQHLTTQLAVAFQAIEQWKGAYDHEAVRVDKLMAKLSELKPPQELAHHQFITGMSLAQPKREQKEPDKDDDAGFPSIVQRALDARAFDASMSRQLEKFAITNLRAGRNPKWIAEQIMVGMPLEPEYDDEEIGLEGDEDEEQVGQEVA